MRELVYLLLVEDTLLIHTSLSVLLGDRNAPKLNLTPKAGHRPFGHALSSIPPTASQVSFRFP